MRNVELLEINRALLFLPATSSRSRHRSDDYREQHAIAEIGRLYMAGLSAYAICAVLDKSHHRPRGSRWSVGLVIKVLKRLGLWAVSPSTSDVPPRQRPAQ